MKRLAPFLICLVLFWGCITSSLYAEEMEMQKVNVSYTIKYNNLTLEEAADKEILLKKRFKDACKVSVEVEEVAYLTLTYTTE